MPFTWLVKLYQELSIVGVRHARRGQAGPQLHQRQGHHHLLRRQAGVLELLHEPFPSTQGTSSIPKQTSKSITNKYFRLGQEAQNKSFPHSSP